MNQSMLFEKIEAYLLDQMSEEQRLAFEFDLAQNPELERLVARQREEQKMMELLVEDDLRAKLKVWETQEALPENEPGVVRQNKPVRRRIFWSLAVLLVAALLGWLFLQKQKPPAPPANLPKTEQPVAGENQGGKDEKALENKAPLPGEKQVQPTPGKPGNSAWLALAEEFSEKTDFTEGIRRSGEEAGDGFKNALTALAEKRYAEGIASLRSVPPGDPRFWDAQYWLGLAYFERKNFPAAIPLLEKVAENEGYLFSERAAWFLAMIYLQTGQISKCAALADQMAADSGHSFHQKAKVLKARLELEGESF